MQVGDHKSFAKFFVAEIRLKSKKKKKLYTHTHTNLCHLWQNLFDNIFFAITIIKKKPFVQFYSTIKANFKLWILVRNRKTNLKGGKVHLSIYNKT